MYTVFFILSLGMLVTSIPPPGRETQEDDSANRLAICPAVKDLIDRFEYLIAVLTQLNIKVHSETYGQGKARVKRLLSTSRIIYGNKASSSRHPWNSGYGAFMNQFY